MRRLLAALTILMAASASMAVEPVRGSAVSGRCLSARDGQALCFAAVVVKELNLSLLTDMDGRFEFPAVEGEVYTLAIHCMNCVEREVRVTAGGNETVDIALDEQSYALKEVEVMAEYDPQKGSAATISQQALEHIQPASVGDVLQLMPGGLYQQGDATGFSRISLRQSGADDNTSLGVGIAVDGIAMDNDGFRSQIGAMAAEDDYAGRLGWNKGVDLKTLSTDHVQRIEIIKGISSAKWGNLSSGLMSINSKVGQTPLQIRLKADPLGKLAYAGKGFRLPAGLGFLHAGVDYTTVYDDRRDPLSKYSRLTSQVTWSNSASLLGRPLFLFLRLSETYTLNQAKEDELTAEYNESFRNKYSRTQAAFKARWLNTGRIVDNVEWIASADYTYDRVDRNRYVQLDLPLPMPTGDEEGEHEGVFLPTAYYSPFYIENRPLALLLQLNGESIVETVRLRSRIIYGAEWRYTRNSGAGVSVDMARPPYPDDSEYVRPTPNYSIPALSVGAAYAEEQLTHGNRLFDLSLNAGVRVSKMLNLDRAYVNLRRPYAEPRLNGAVSFNVPLSAHALKVMARAGWGQENKLPTLDHIYPDPVYKDLIVLSAYISKGNEFNHLITDTRKYDVTNHDLSPNRNTKAEVGLDMDYRGFKLSLTAFREQSRRGFNSETRYHGVAYNRYFTPVDGTIVGKRPEKSDYVEDHYETFVDMPVVRNSMRTVKRGVEYRLALPRFDAICTSVEVNGAFYRTEYGQTSPLEYHPAAKEDGRPMPYVGIYERADATLKRTFNTNVWFNTNVPRYKMVFSTLFQVVWLNDVRRLNGDEYPSRCRDVRGGELEVTDDMIRKISGGDIIWRNYHIYKEDYYEEDPVAVSVNFKMTKEFSRHARGAFFINNIIDVNPMYRNRYLQNTRKWAKPHFGAELTFSI